MREENARIDAAEEAAFGPAEKTAAAVPPAPPFVGAPYAAALVMIESGEPVRRASWPLGNFIALAGIEPVHPWIRRWALERNAPPKLNYAPRHGALFMFHPDSTCEGYVPSAEDVVARDWVQLFSPAK